MTPPNGPRKFCKKLPGLTKVAGSPMDLIYSSTFALLSQ